MHNPCTSRKYSAWSREDTTFMRIISLKSIVRIIQYVCQTALHRTGVINCWSKLWWPVWQIRSSWYIKISSTHHTGYFMKRKEYTSRKHEDFVKTKKRKNIKFQFLFKKARKFTHFLVKYYVMSYIISNRNLKNEISSFDRPLV